MLYLKSKRSLVTSFRREAEKLPHKRRVKSPVKPRQSPQHPNTIVILYSQGTDGLVRTVGLKAARIGSGSKLNSKIFTYSLHCMKLRTTILYLTASALFSLASRRLTRIFASILASEMGR